VNSPSSSPTKEYGAERVFKGEVGEGNSESSGEGDGGEQTKVIPLPMLSSLPEVYSDIPTPDAPSTPPEEAGDKDVQNAESAAQQDEDESKFTLSEDDLPSHVRSIDTHKQMHESTVSDPEQDIASNGEGHEKEGPVSEPVTHISYVSRLLRSRSHPRSDLDRLNPSVVMLRTTCFSIWPTLS